MISPNTLVLTLWLIWILIWIAAAFSAARTAEKAARSERFGERVLLTAGAVLMFLHPSTFGVLLQPLLPMPAWVPWLGVAVTALGLGVAVWARVKLGRLWSGTAAIKVQHTIVRSGPYGVARHPIYSGILLALLGTAVTRHTLGALLGLVLLVVGLLLRIRHEEHLLIDHFGDEYRRYQREVPAVVPHLWPPRNERV
jgi:protein-S-isoprenylcysteine O-methyltransferase Ste14